MPPPRVPERSGTPGTRIRTISTSRSSDGWPIQWKSARRLSASCSSRVRLEVSRTTGLRRASIVPISGIVIWKSESTSSRNASNSSSARSISSMRSTTCSSESIASSSGRRMRNSGPEELVLGHGPLLRGADVEELARVVPLVDRVRDVEPFVALEANQARAKGFRERLPRLGLPDAGLALEQDRLLEREREEERRREPAVGQVVGLAERLRELVDRVEGHSRSVLRCAT